jgi:anhydro-N-acetylmuramic acid kinase
VNPAGSAPPAGDGGDPPVPAQGGAVRYIGLMSGTSLDGIDGVVAEVSAAHPLRVTHHRALPFSPELRSELLALNAAGDDELHRAALAGNALSRRYADAVAALLADAGLAPSAIRAIGAHGQTVRHRPQEFDGTGYTLQLQNPSLLAERTGIPVVADFRSRDLAAGGQGAPLVPAFHAQVFGRPGRTVGVLNLGGIANLSVLAADGRIAGFDCGPGNVLLDHWCRAHTGAPFDRDGAWAAGGRALPELLARLRADPYFGRQPPKSTGRDLFHADWLDARLASHGASVAPVDVQATLAALTATACADDVRRHAPGCASLVVCGGGALNGELMRRLQRALPEATVESSDRHGLPPLQVEAAAFAWLAHRMLQGLPGSLPEVTGARGPRVLGALYPA